MFEKSFIPVTYIVLPTYCSHLFIGYSLNAVEAFLLDSSHQFLGTNQNPWDLYETRILFTKCLPFSFYQLYDNAQDCVIM